ncbi:hypothetical protein BD410DRAFT_732577 [Rickenella mellea]|uniref:HAT C-terminal dimerisation domain-containing protein n=1 Tax=Rickenella mellea TaxID=50990 RepID=A0A4Y7PL70_9AGAM|nr:hypothetical protein BD410DRAFT_732577 [Rickenella mellea]
MLPLCTFTTNLKFFIVLHPRYKTSYFIKHGWPADWVQTAVDLLRAEWEKNYKPRLRSDNEVSSNDAMHDLFNAIDNWGLQAGSDPLDDWLASPPIVSVRDPLAWWGALLNDGNVLAAMAIDILSTPGK